LPVCGLPDSETRRRRATALYEVETGFREEGWPLEEFVYDGERDLYRFSDGEFAFSREYTNERRLREMGGIG
jgi:hypothetical protein